jgi:hypothetical protein
VIFFSKNLKKSRLRLKLSASRIKKARLCCENLAQAHHILEQGSGHSTLLRDIRVIGTAWTIAERRSV